MLVAVMPLRKRGRKALGGGGEVAEDRSKQVYDGKRSCEGTESRNTAAGIGRVIVGGGRGGGQRKQ